MGIYLGLGSNINDPVIQIESAIAEIAKLPHTQVLRSSSFYMNAFEGGDNEPDCVNAVIKIDSKLNPWQLLQEMQQLENQHHRIRNRINNFYSSRTLDIDILLFDQKTMQEPMLHIPHPKLYERGFVLVPLFEIEPKLILPNGKTLKEWLPHIEWQGQIIKQMKK